MDWKLFNPAYATRHAAASLSPNSRLNIQLSRYLTCRLDSVSFLLEERIENPELFCQSTRTQHFVSFSFSWRVSWKFNSSFNTRYTRYVDSVSLSTKSGIFDMPTRQHFLFFYQKRGLEKSRPLLPVNLYLEFRFFFLKSELKIQLCFYQSIRWPLFNLSQERIEKSSFTRVFLPLDMWTGCFYHTVDEKRSSLTQLFPLFETKTCCLFFFFCDSTRLFMWSVPCLWFSHFVPCALVCVSNPVPKGIFILFCRRTFKQEVLHA